MADKFRTGDDPIAGSRIYKLTLPDTPWFVREFSDLMADIAEAANWEQAGDVTVDDAVAAGLDTYFSLELQNEPPIAEDAGELDGEPQQPWYDELADWIIAGFLAITFTPEAAIMYRATIPKMRVAFRTGSLGAAIKILLNNLEIWTGDSYGPIPGILEQVLDLQAFADTNNLGDPPWDLRIIHDGDPGEKLEFIRQPLPVPSEGGGRMIGEILWGAWGEIPDNCLACDGAEYSKETYAELWAVLDSVYEVDETHFRVPDLQGRAPVGVGAGEGLTERSIDDSGGEESHQLTVNEMPSHRHSHYPSGATGTLTYWSVGGTNGTNSPGGHYTFNEGGDGTHNNMPPFNALHAVIVFE